MGRLRDRGQELSDRYEEQTQLMEERLRELEAMARAGELTAGIVHEVRNGLGTIVGYARLLERGSREQASKEARAILDECATLETVVRRFTDFVKLDKLQLADIDLAPLAARVVARERRGHEAVVARLSGLDSPVVVRADEELLERALENVVRNAVQAAAVGGDTSSCARSRARAEWCCTWRTTVPGLAADHPGHLRPFYTTPSRRARPRPAARPQDRAAARGELSLERRSPKGVRVVLRLPADGRTH